MEIIKEDDNESEGPCNSLLSKKMKLEYNKDERSKDLQLIAIEPGTLTDNEGYITPCVNIWGRSSIGRSVHITCTDFYPYFYFETGFEVTEYELKLIHEQIENFILNEFPKYPTKKPVQSIEQLLDRSSIIGYTETPSVFIKVTLCIPHFVVKTRKFIENDDNFSVGGKSHFNTYESNFEFILRWMVDNGACGGGWIEFNPDDDLSNGNNNNNNNNSKISFCDEEYTIQTSKLSCKSIEERGDHSGIRLFSFDIECAARPGQFPEATRDKVIQIAVTTEVFQKPETNHTTIFVLHSCNEIKGKTVITYDDERDLLMGFRDFMIKYDPDIVMGYNIKNFDWPYLIKRAETLKLDEFRILSRMRNTKCRCIKKKFQSNAYGTSESYETNLSGRWNLDIYQEIKRNCKLRSYKLGFVSEHFLGDQKEDVHHSQITPLFNGNEEDRARLAVYCAKDAELPLRLYHVRMIGFNNIEMSRVTIVPLSFIFERGQSIRVITQIYSQARSEKRLIPKIVSSDDDVTYSGATVFDPIRGFYKKPVATLDFSSLYPSIMIAHNLCYTTLMKKPDERSTTTPKGSHFIKKEYYQGLLPRILQRLLSQRKKAKVDLANETDPLKKSILDGRQLALKISANSVYGFTGAAVGKLPCFEISESVTTFGRQMIGKTAEIVREVYSKKNGYEHDATVIYGDTDSVMVVFGVDTVEEAMALGKEAAKLVTKQFISPINLDFEKVYYPYLLINKKRYAGYYWTKPDKYDRLDAKGIESVRRDNCKLVSQTVDECIRLLLDEQSPELAANYFKETIRKLLMSEINVSDLVITKQLAKQSEEYNSNGPHIELAKKLKERDPATAPRVGDRVPYVLIKGDKKQKMYQLAEDPLHVIKNGGVEIDYELYIENCFRKPMTRIFSPLMKNTESLFAGDHTLVRRNLPKPQIDYNNNSNNINNRQPSLLSFLKKKERCRTCGNPVEGEGIICSKCSASSKKIKSDLETQKKTVIKDIEDMGNTCFTCSGKRDTLKTCNSVDCSIFYERYVKKYKHESIEADLRKLSLSEKGN